MRDCRSAQVNRQRQTALLCQASKLAAPTCLRLQFVAYLAAAAAALGGRLRQPPVPARMAQSPGAKQPVSSKNSSKLLLQLADALLHDLKFPGNHGAAPATPHGVRPERRELLAMCLTFGLADGL